MIPEDAAMLAKVQGLLAMRGRGCGECTACCTIMAVDMSPVSPMQKPERTKCTHECRHGCSIYENKPDSCTEFMCLWLAMEMFDNNWPARWRPDRVGAVLDVNSIGNVTVHLKHENAWQKPGDLRDMLLYLANTRTPLTPHGRVILDRPSQNHLLFHRNGTTQELVPIGVGPTGLKQYRTKSPGE